VGKLNGGYSCKILQRLRNRLGLILSRFGGRFIVLLGIRVGFDFVIL
jgi:hypothetical protein